jgi:hypothetical protein
MIFTPSMKALHSYADIPTSRLLLSSSHVRDRRLLAFPNFASWQIVLAAREASELCQSTTLFVREGAGNAG